MNTLRKVLLCTTLALLVLLVPTIFAQETFGLSEEDFALLTAANVALEDLQSFAFDAALDLSVTGMGSDVTGNLSASGEADTNEEAPAFGVVLDGEITAEGETQAVNAEVRLVDGILYANENGEGWEGQPADDLFSEFSSMAGGALPVNPEDLASGDLSDLAGMEGMSEAMAALAALDPSEFISMTRDDVDGLAHFTANLSISDLLSSPALAPMMMMGMSGGAGTQGMEMSDEQLQMMSQMMAQMFSEATVTLEEYIDPATNLIHRLVLTINIPIPDMSGTGSGSGVIAFSFDLSLSNHNQPVTIEAPADAVMTEAS